MTTVAGRHEARAGLGRLMLMNWPDVTLAGMLISAVTVLLLFGTPENTEIRSTVIAMVGILSPWIATFRTNKQIDQVRHDVEALRGDTAGPPR